MPDTVGIMESMNMSQMAANGYIGAKRRAYAMTKTARWRQIIDEAYETTISSCKYANCLLTGNADTISFQIPQHPIDHHGNPDEIADNGVFTDSPRQNENGNQRDRNKHERIHLPRPDYLQMEKMVNSPKRSASRAFQARQGKKRTAWKTGHVRRIAEVQKDQSRHAGNNGKRHGETELSTR